MSSPQLSGLMDAALEISRRRAETLGQLRDALERGETEEALELAKQLVGLSDEQESNRTDTSVN
jgi:hypothetical protein